METKLHIRLRELENEEEHLNDIAKKGFENIFQFNIATGLGKTYRTVQLKIRIINRILNQIS